MLGCASAVPASSRAQRHPARGLQCSTHDTFNTATSRCSRLRCRSCAKKNPKSQKGGGRGKKTPPQTLAARQEVQTGPGSEAPEQPAAAGSRSPRVTRRPSDIVEIQNSRWLFLGGFFFFFSLPHFQGNKTRCHLLVAIEISPDSASAEEKAGRARCRGATSHDRLQTYWEEPR